MEPEMRFEQADGPRSRQCQQCKLSLDVAGETVGRAEVNDLTMRLAGAWVRMGGIANVVVQSQHRGKGYANRLMREAVSYMEREGYAVSILFGIPDFYHRFGFVPVMPEYNVSVAVRDAERLAATTTVREAQQEDHAGLLDLYTRANASRSGAVRRTRVFYEALADEVWWGHPTRILVTGEAGHPTGYMLLEGDPATLSVMDVIVPAEHVATAGASLIAWLGREALVRRRERLRLPVPPGRAAGGAAASELAARSRPRTRPTTAAWAGSWTWPHWPRPSSQPSPTAYRRCRWRRGPAGWSSTARTPGRPTWSLGAARYSRFGCPSNNCSNC